MHYVAVVEGQEHEVEISEAAGDKYVVVIDGRRFEMDGRAISDTTLSLLVDNEAYSIEFETNPEGGENLLVRGELLQVEVLDLRKMQLRRAQESVGGADGPTVVSTPMPGKVVAVLVKEGDEVKKGQGVVVVEAMKMENELKAPRDGVVAELTAVEGSAVESNASLCVIE